MEDKKKKTYFAESQKRYGDKCKTYAVKYTPSEIDEVKIMEDALMCSGLSANTWIKKAIHEKLEKDGFIVV